MAKYRGTKRKNGNSQLQKIRAQNCILARAARLGRLNRCSADIEDVQMDAPEPQQNDEGVVVVPINQPIHGGGAGGAAEEVQAQIQENVAARAEPQQNAQQEEAAHNPNNGNVERQQGAGDQLMVQDPREDAEQKPSDMILASPSLNMDSVEQDQGNNTVEQQTARNLLMAQTPKHENGTLSALKFSDPRDTMPGQIQTTPENIITFNVSFDISQTHIMKIQNLSDRRVAFKMMSNCPDRIEFYPLFGTVKQGEFTYIKVKTKPFQFDCNFGDRVFVTWNNAPRNGIIEEEWFMDRGTRSQKIMAVEYLS